MPPFDDKQARSLLRRLKNSQGFGEPHGQPWSISDIVEKTDREEQEIRELEELFNLPYKEELDA